MIDPENLVDSVREGLVVLGPDLRVRFANRMFLAMFSLSQREAVGQDLTELAGGRFDTNGLRSLVENVISEDSVVEQFDIEGDFPMHGRRVIRVNVRKVHAKLRYDRQALLAFEDVTEIVDVERSIERHQRLIEGMVDTVRQPLLVLDGDLTVVAASRSFFLTFGVSRSETLGHRLPELGDGQWNIPDLQNFLRRVVPDNEVVEDFEVEHEFPKIGRRTMLLNARKTFREGNDTRTFLLSIEDVTDRRRLEAEREAALKRVEALLEELNHRVMNSLSIISSVIAMEGRSLTDDAARSAFDRVSGRVMAVAKLYKTLSMADSLEWVDARLFLETISNEVVNALQSERTPLTLVTELQSFSMTSQEAISVGLVLNELLTNAIKYAFEGRDSGEITVSTRVDDDRVSLSVADNGVGTDESARVDSGIGGKLIELFCRQLEGETARRSGGGGTVAELTFPLVGSSDTAGEASRPDNR